MNSSSAEFQGTDEELRNRVLENPDQGWGELWARHSQTIRGSIAKYHLSREDASDVLQEFSLRLAKDDFRLLKCWQPERCSLKGFLGVVAGSCTLDFLRSRFGRDSKRFSAWKPAHDEGLDPLNLLESAEESPAGRFQRLEMESAIRKCIEQGVRSGKLQARNRLLLEGRLLGVTFEKIATTLGITEDNATRTFSRLREGLRTCLERLGVTPADCSE